MAQIPMAPELGNRTRQVRQGVNVASGQNAGLDAIARLAQVGSQLGIQIHQNKQAVKLSTATTQAGQDIDSFVQTLKQEDRDYDTQLQRYQDFVKDLETRYAKELDDQDVYGAWKSKLDQYAYKKGLDVQSHAFTGQLDVQKAQLLSNLENLQEMYLNGDQEERDMLNAEASMQLQQGYELGVITAEEMTQARIQFEQTAVTSQVRKDILENPDTAVANLQENKYTGLNATQQSQLLEKATKAAEAKDQQELAEMARLEREQEKAERKMREETSKAGDKLLAAGELTEAWIEAHHDNLSEEDYRYFYKQLTSTSDNTDPYLYSDLRMRASNGEDVREEARDALRAGKLKTSDYDKLLNRSEQNSGLSNLPNFYKRGEQFIARSLRVSDVNPDPSAPQRLANAMDDWTDWVADNPDATHEQAQQTYKRIVDEYAILNFKEMTLTKRMPQFAVGSRDDLDLEASMQATVAAFQSGEIGDEEFTSQAQLLKEWETAMQAFKGGAEQ